MTLHTVSSQMSMNRRATSSRRSSTFNNHSGLKKSARKQVERKRCVRSSHASSSASSPREEEGTTSQKDTATAISIHVPKPAISQQVVETGDNSHSNNKLDSVFHTNRRARFISGRMGRNNEHSSILMSSCMSTKKTEHALEKLTTIRGKTSTTSESLAALENNGSTLIKLNPPSTSQMNRKRTHQVPKRKDKENISDNHGTPTKPTREMKKKSSASSEHNVPTLFGTTATSISLVAERRKAAAERYRRRQASLSGEVAEVTKRQRQAVSVLDSLTSIPRAQKEVSKLRRETENGKKDAAGCGVAPFNGEISQQTESSLHTLPPRMKGDNKRPDKLNKMLTHQAINGQRKANRAHHEKRQNDLSESVNVALDESDIYNNSSPLQNFNELMFSSNDVGLNRRELRRSRREASRKPSNHLISKIRDEDDVSTLTNILGDSTPLDYKQPSPFTVACADGKYNHETLATEISAALGEASIIKVANGSQLIAESNEVAVSNQMIDLTVEHGDGEENRTTEKVNRKPRRAKNRKAAHKLLDLTRGEDKKSSTEMPLKKRKREKTLNARRKDCPEPNQVSLQAAEESKPVFLSVNTNSETTNKNSKLPIDSSAESEIEEPTLERPKKRRKKAIPNKPKSQRSSPRRRTHQSQSDSDGLALEHSQKFATVEPASLDPQVVVVAQELNITFPRLWPRTPASTKSLPLVATNNNSVSRTSGLSNNTQEDDLQQNLNQNLSARVTSVPSPLPNPKDHQNMKTQNENEKQSALSQAKSAPDGKGENSDKKHFDESGDHEPCSILPSLCDAKEVDLPSTSSDNIVELPEKCGVPITANTTEGREASLINPRETQIRKILPTRRSRKAPDRFHSIQQWGAKSDKVIFDVETAESSTTQPEEVVNVQSEHPRVGPVQQAVQKDVSNFDAYGDRQKRSLEIKKDKKNISQRNQKATGPVHDGQNMTNETGREVYSDFSATKPAVKGEKLNNQTSSISTTATTLQSKSTVPDKSSSPSEPVAQSDAGKATEKRKLRILPARRSRKAPDRFHDSQSWTTKKAIGKVDSSIDVEVAKSPAVTIATEQVVQTETETKASKEHQKHDTYCNVKADEVEKEEGKVRKRVSFSGTVQMEHLENESLVPKPQRTTVVVKSPANEKGTQQDLSEWADEDTVSLRTAVAMTDPTSNNFWNHVSEQMNNGRNADDCREKWFALLNTPNDSKRENTSKQKQKRSEKSKKNNVSGDDIFHSTPLRERNALENNNDFCLPFNFAEDDFPTSPILDSANKQKKDKETSHNDYRQNKTNNDAFFDHVRRDSPLMETKGYKTYIKGIAQEHRKCRQNRIPTDPMTMPGEEEEEDHLSHHQQLATGRYFDSESFKKSVKGPCDSDMKDLGYDYDQDSLEDGSSA